MEFFYHSPSTPIADTIYTAGNSCNGDGTPNGDAWNFGMNVPVVVYPDTTTEVRDQPAIPQSALLQNFPNPFNPRTTIGLNISRATRGRLAIYDLTGREIAHLFEGVLIPGYHQFDWNAENEASGMYYYLFQTSKRVEFGKMLLIR